VWMALAMMVKTRVWLGGRGQRPARHDPDPTADRAGPPRTVRCWSVPMGCARTSGRFARPFAILYTRAWAEGPGFVRGAMC
jgi:hypothetical protein